VRSSLSRAGRFERAVARRADADGILEHPRHVRLVHQAGGQCSMLPDSNIVRSLPSVAGTLTTSMPVAFVNGSTMALTTCPGQELHSAYRD